VCVPGIWSWTTKGALNGVKANTQFWFKPVQAATNHGSSSFTVIMQKECEKYHMKPVCDNPSYCNTDTKSVYLGQNSVHVSRGPAGRHQYHQWPSGWTASQANRWGTTSPYFCAYTLNANGNSALCETSGSNTWQTWTLSRPTQWGHMTHA
jgi:hypothetical protein